MIWLILGSIAVLTWFFLSLARAAGRASEAERRRDGDR